MSALVLVAEASVTSATTYVSLTGFSDSYYTYKVIGSGIKQGTLGNLTFRFLDADSGTAGLSTQHYDYAGRQMKSTGGDVFAGSENQTHPQFSPAMGDSSSGVYNTNFVMTIHNVRGTRDNYNWGQFTMNETSWRHGDYLTGSFGGGQYSISSNASDRYTGIVFMSDTGSATIDSGEFKMYGYAIS